MTDNSPQVRATAHLDLVSPAPVHPPSPIVIPALQDQADTYFNSLSRGNNSLALTPALIPEMPKFDGQTCASQVTIQLSSPKHASYAGQPHLGASDSGKCADSLDKRAGTSIEARKALVPGTTDAQQNGYSSSEPNLKSDVSTMSCYFGIATSRHGDNQASLSSSLAPPSSKEPQAVPNTTIGIDISAQHSRAVNPYASNDPQPNGPIYSVENYQTTLDTVAVQIPNAGSSATCNFAHSNSIPLAWNNEPIYSNHTQTTNKPAFADACIMGEPSVTSNHATPVSLPDPMSSKHPEKEKVTPKNERKGLCEAKRKTFPIGSRVFIGNLSASVRQKDINELFSKYGHVEEISLKRESYGFVQYRSAADGQAAIKHLNGRNLGGKKINLEIARGENKNGGGNRGSRGRRDSNRHNSNRRRQDDRRSKRRSSTPQPNQYQQMPDDKTDRDRIHKGSNSSSKGHRSKSPRGDDHDLYTYRQRSLSPYRQPRRGAEISDVHLVLGDVSHSFLAMVMNEFINNGLSVGFSSLDPRLGHHEAIQRLVVEGVRAVVILDYHMEERGLISLDLFDHQDGVNNVRFDQYRDLPPDVIARIILSRRPQVQPGYHSSQCPPASYAPAYVPLSQTYPAPVSSGMKDHNLLATLGSAPQGLEGHLPPHPLPNLVQGVPQAGNSYPQLQNVLTQLARPW
ncbi:hypothetical protein F5B22DRAFT_144952 [Xylaria bambusicola]|uniref:uncharacterized protein n=1 Tax=Xylaria bambusicola TaxID=326684 RepID=UPI0020085E2F|nr:uncharacterized protein F5B22DRAFT_144952 [Xylaria bambusicola]KAI0517055.1 hypothetical protein F5B22DRAFT_144952 [Xylaria bambusicola]